MDGRTIFYLTRPLPADYEPPPSPRIDRDTGSFRISDLTGQAFIPDLTIRTSDGWSCSLADCGSTG
ncbi:hypothetical protein [Nocardioides antri]|uniref:Uncharacterized protein n=1 Tax=Nocardioides antri TaxID=2607659 RepID=A0A5B1M3X2_9ACTN|nr:hypothetical protein [Nocardioides antri]KAA1427356.1 hypothetical protein F0U47_07685 [Nocardioides antri]